MKTKKRAEFFRDCRDLLSLIHRRRPTAIPAALVTALLESAFPFVNILFGARILDRLLAGGEGVMELVGWMVALDFVLGCGSRVLRWSCRAEALTADELSMAAVAEKCLTMDYQQLETQEIMDKKVRAVEGSRNQIHLCGNASHLFPAIQQELNVYTFDTGFPVRHGRLVQELAPGTVILGGVHVDLLLNGDAEAIRAETRRILEEVKPHTRSFIIKEANNLSPGTRPESLLAMHEAVRQYGRYENPMTP